MSKTNYSNPEIGALADAATVNGVFTSLQTASASLNADNFREEGLHRNVVAAEPVVSKKFYIYGDPVTPTFFNAGAWTTLTVGATLMQSPAVVVAAGERLRVHAALELMSYASAASFAASQGLSPGGDIEWGLYYTFNGGPLSPILYAVGQHIDDGGTQGTNGICNVQADAVVAGTYTFELRARMNAGTANLAAAQMLGLLYKRAN